MYPNPATQEVNIVLSLGRDYGKSVIRISDMLGRSIKEQEVMLQQGENKFVLTGLSALRSGTYHITVMANGLNISVQKLIIQ
jgi:hypothetical protein